MTAPPPGAPAIRLTLHATISVARRNIDMRWIEAVIRQPAYSSPDPDDAAVTQSWRAIPQFGGRMLKVVHRPAGDDVIVITAYFDRDAKR